MRNGWVAVIPLVRGPKSRLAITQFLKAFRRLPWQTFPA